MKRKFLSFIVVLLILCSYMCFTTGCVSHTHEFKDYVYNQDATCLADGTETAICSKKFCTASYTRTKVGSKLNHNYGTPIYEWNGDSCVAILSCLNDSCSHIETENAIVTYVKDSDATCTTEEKGHYVANFANENFEKQETALNSISIGVPEHTYSNKGKCSCGESAILQEFDGMGKTFAAGDVHCLHIYSEADSLLDMPFYIIKSDFSEYSTADVTVYDENGNVIIEKMKNISQFKMDLITRNHYYIIIIPQQEVVLTGFPLE